METQNEFSKVNEIGVIQDEIIRNLNNPVQLEVLYRRNEVHFKKAFGIVYSNHQESIVARVWHERLKETNDTISWGTKYELLIVAIIALVAVLIAKVPLITGIGEDYYYMRNIGFIGFPALIAYFIFKHKVQWKRSVGIFVAILVAAVFINWLPDNSDSHTLILSCIHLPLFLWTLLGLVFVADKPFDTQRRLDFLRYNGDVVVMGAIILIALILLTMLTIGMFSLIGIDIREFYGEYVIVSGISATPVIATYIVRSNPNLVNKVSPVIARVFTPLVFVTLIVYLVTVIYTGKDPYNDREFLLVFNGMLIGVMAIILFSVAERSQNGSRWSLFLLTGLSVVAVIVSGIALSAIVFRIIEWGITPNKLAVMGGNILMLIHLIIVTIGLVKTLRNQHKITDVERNIVFYLPVYSVWTLLVTFLFPILFGFK